MICDFKFSGTDPDSGEEEDGEGARTELLERAVVHEGESESEPLDIIASLLCGQQRAVGQHDSRRYRSPRGEPQHEQVRPEEPHECSTGEDRTDSHPSAFECLVLIEPIQRILRIAKTRKDEP